MLGFEFGGLYVTVEEAVDEKSCSAAAGRAPRCTRIAQARGPCFPGFRYMTALTCSSFGSYICLFQEKETKKNEPKEKYQKGHDLDKEEKGRKEPKGLKSECEY